MDDLISRKAAVEIASGFCHPANIAKELAKLPSAQPKIIRCKDCKHHGTNGYRLTCAVFCCTMPDDGFCSCGERREDG